MDSIKKYIAPVLMALTAFVAGIFHYTGKHTYSNITPHKVIETPTAFIQWFNISRQSNTQLYPYKIDSINFIKYFEAVKKINNDSLDFRLFLCYFLTAYNETGGTFKSISEYGSDSYFFNQMKLPFGWKVSYNSLKFNKTLNTYFFENKIYTYPKDSNFILKIIDHLHENRPAGMYLVSKGVLKYPKDSTRINQWNGSIYPTNEPLAVRLEARNADFYKFRGHGFIQITGRSNYRRFVKPLLPNLDTLTYKQLEDSFKLSKIAVGSMNNYLSNYYKIKNRIEIDNPEWDAFGHLISGSSPYHDFKMRAQILYDEIIRIGFNQVFYRKKDNI
jgi:hypothetical protein